MSTNTAKHNKTWKAQQNKAKQSFAKHGFVKTEKKKKTIFYIATANFWTKIIICFVNDCRKQGFLLYIIGGNVNGTKFKPGNLLLYIKITTLIFLRIYPADIFIPMQNDIYTKLLIALLSCQALSVGGAFREIQVVCPHRWGIKFLLYQRDGMSWLSIGLLVCSFHKNTEELCQFLGMEKARKTSCSHSLVWVAR